MQDSLEEALCFGWVDSIIQKIDEEKYARKFTPRKAGSKWSELNKHLVAKLIQEGRMTEAGLAKVDFPLSEAPAARPKRPDLPLPDWLKAGLMTSPKAWENFNKLAAIPPEKLYRLDLGCQEGRDPPAAHPGGDSDGWKRMKAWIEIVQRGDPYDTTWNL